ncbi:hypothetical protein [Synechococcus sp. CCY 9618]|uniref:hypothetical protein n=1 Tax=Synechococcus sp. CCY 9618 TaxID=2815602 RepID=UPI001C2490C1|nr:hypothetical protein [Synechococcus sp. CCY 9618]
MSLLRLSGVLLLIGCCRPAAAQPLTPPPLKAPVPPGPVIPPISRADPQLEAALQARLFAGPVAATPTAAGDPDQTEWEQARATGQHPSCNEVGPLRYMHNRIDLDGDGRLETVALVVGSYACSSDGCTLMVFRDGAGGLELVAENGLFQSPLRVISQRHRGWLDLTMPASLHGAPEGLMELVFNGHTYRPLAGGAARYAAATPPGTVVLELLPLPFEQLGQPLPCGS